MGGVAHNIWMPKLFGLGRGIRSTNAITVKTNYLNSFARVRPIAVFPALSLFNDEIHFICSLKEIKCIHPRVVRHIL